MYDPSAEREIADLRRKVSELEAKESLWREYVELLAAELRGLVGIAVAHGWPGNQANFEKGCRLRAALKIEPITGDAP